MLKPQMPNIPGVAAVTDTLDFVKNLWGSMSVPGMNIPGVAAPTLSVDELDKKIADLKAVESWLNVNVSMLRGTIQALEVQRGTIATLKSMGATLANAVKQPGANEKSVLAAAPYASAFFQQPAAEPAAKPAEPAAKQAETAAWPRTEDKKPAPAAPADSAAGKEGAAMPNPVLWWNMLQDQFKQAVSTAMSSDAVADAVASASNMAQDAAAKLTAASSGQTAKSSKTAPPETAPAQAAKPAGKRAAAKPRASKSSASKGDS